MGMGTLAGRRIAIAGGARELEQEAALAFLGAGARVVLGDRSAAAARRRAARLAHSTGAAVLGARVIAYHEDCFTAFLAEAHARLGGLDVVVNTVEAAPGAAQAPDLTPAIVGARVAARMFTARGHGHIVNAGSAAGVAGALGAAVYCATKYALVEAAGLRGRAVTGDILLSTVAPGGAADAQRIAAAVADCVAHGRNGLVTVGDTDLATVQSSSRRTRTRTFPLGLRGSSGRKSTSRGTL